MKKIVKILPHVNIILAVLFITLWVLDKLNPIMNFINNSISNVLLIIFFVVSMANSILFIAYERKNDK